eukprot:tig00000137_g8134.t1
MTEIRNTIVTFPLNPVRLLRGDAPVHTTYLDALAKSIGNESFEAWPKDTPPGSVLLDLNRTALKARHLRCN